MAARSEAFRARGYITADAREQTAYGTARAYIDVGINTNDTGLQVGYAGAQLEPRVPAMGGPHDRSDAIVL